MVTACSVSTSSRNASNSSSARSTSSTSSTLGAGLQRPQDRPGQQEPRRRRARPRSRSRPAAPGRAGRRLQRAQVQQLAGEVPVVERLRGVDAVVALQPDQLGAEHLRPAPARARSCRCPARPRRTAGGSSASRGTRRWRARRRRGSRWRAARRPARRASPRRSRTIGHLSSMTERARAASAAESLDVTDPIPGVSDRCDAVETLPV